MAATHPSAKLTAVRQWAPTTLGERMGHDAIPTTGFQLCSIVDIDDQSQTVEVPTPHAGRVLMRVGTVR